MLLSIYFEEPPTGVMAEAVGADGVHVIWELPPDTVCRIDFSVFFTPEREGGETLSTGVGTAASEYTVQNLLCNTAYVFTVGSVAREDGSVSLSEGVRVLVGGNYSYYCLFTIANILSSRSQEFLCSSGITHFSPSDLGASCI